MCENKFNTNKCGGSNEEKGYLVSTQLLSISAMLLASCGSSTIRQQNTATTTTTLADTSTVTVTYGSVTKTYSMADMQTM